MFLFYADTPIDTVGDLIYVLSFLCLDKFIVFTNKGVGILDIAIMWTKRCRKVYTGETRWHRVYEQDLWAHLKKNAFFLSKDIYEDVRPVYSVLQKLYDLSKTHKDTIPLRSTVSMMSLV